jgi:cobalt-precorrin-5B (C1)-methyltransferase
VTPDDAQPKPRAAGRGRRGARTGFTTGANAAAAATAAALGLVSGHVPGRVECLLPNGQRVTFAIDDGWTDGERARAVSVKDAGDDPDVTHGARLTAEVRRLSGGGGMLVLGGTGVGIVTRPGLGLAVGGPAINPVPRRNIMENLSTAGEALLADGDGLEVTISVPGGEAIARKTLNARLGILGGISILGTTGIVRPYSTASFRASLVQAVQVAAAQGEDTLVFTTGGRTERCAMGSCLSSHRSASCRWGTSCGPPSGPRSTMACAGSSSGPWSGSSPRSPRDCPSPTPGVGRWIVPW